MSEVILIGKVMKNGVITHYQFKNSKNRKKFFSVQGSVELLSKYKCPQAQIRSRNGIPFLTGANGVNIMRDIKTVAMPVTDKPILDTIYSPEDEMDVAMAPTKSGTVEVNTTRELIVPDRLETSLGAEILSIYIGAVKEVVISNGSVKKLPKSLYSSIVLVHCNARPELGLKSFYVNLTEFARIALAELTDVKYLDNIKASPPTSSSKEVLTLDKILQSIQ